MGLLDKFKKKRQIVYTNKLDTKRLGRSFKAAFSGIKETYVKEQNIKIHTVMALLVVLFGFLLRISYAEWLVCLVLIGFVLMAEFFNTAIEYVVDLASPDIHPLAKAAKDTASAGVLMMAILSALIGLVIFVPKIVNVVGGMF
ncbi:MAG: diacylglycerol kinase family protein [Mycoplasmatota bacterium]|nr:diacylglycerol kinase family protein [Mycoplasmatota bacterium]